ncbi:transcription factor TFIIIB component B'' homolog [Drosophila virilis]|uniref:Myb-like domain-containing protein n=1 Tax=Drosophila virilis TaxID=7244 RepID=B4M972_DROVI|nr:transcription factor TFIIIB component B'' homolog [Drosophila virilis]EDW57748.1 uncharacterized protein Dvir_GJ18261 [Drosophila virilis]
MSTRRQRIKATANLTQIKRKPRRGETDPEPQAEPEPLPTALAKQEHLDEDAAEVAFKMPAASSAGQLDDVFHSDLEDNVIQMDLQKSSSGFPMSPSKAQARQRLRPTPVFGQRRNSFVGSPLAADLEGDYQSPGTPTRRERYLSGSSVSGGSGTPQQVQASPKYFPAGVMSPGMGRIRTESSCSVYSDSGGGGAKPRKGEGDKAQTQAQQRVNAKRDFETRFNKGIPDKSTFKMFDMIFYNPESNPMEQKPVVTTIKAEASGSSSVSDISDESKPTSAELLETKTEPSANAAMPVPQLKLDANGEMIIDEKTLEIETTAEVEARKVLANSSLILMDETTGDNGFYKRHKRTPTWTSDDTVRFYRSLQIIGTDFSLMCQMFPKRTRRDLKLKYKREERINGQLINKALLYPKAFNIQELKDQLEQEDRERAEADREWQEIVTAQAENTKKRSKSQHSKAARTLSDGDLVYENEHVTKQKLGKHALAKRRAALDSQNGAEAPKRKRRPLKQQLEQDQAQLRNVKQKLQQKLQQKVQQQQKEQLETQQPVPVHILRVFPPAIKKEKEMDTEQISSDPLIETKAEQLQQELNSLLDEGQNEINDKSGLRDLDDGAHNYVSDVDTVTDSETVYTPETDTTYIVDFISETPLLESPNTESVSEHDIEQILAELSEGSMVLVSSLDAEQEDRVINEIYMYDQQTGELCEHPLKIPEHIVQCILNVMS